MTLIDATGGSKTARVMADTWGHLAATPESPYPGTILFACSEYAGEGTIVIRTEGMPDGPWFYYGLLDWVADQPAERGCLYLWTGTYRRGGDDAHHFDGATIEVLPLAEEEAQHG